MSNSASKPKGSGGGNWYDRYRLPQGNATPFVFINAEYIDKNPNPELIELGPDGRPLPVKNAYFKVKSHRRKTFKNGKEWFIDEICGQGDDPHNPKPCAGCTAMDMGDKTVTLSDKFVFGLVHLHPYHRHPLIDYKTNQVRMKQDNSGPIYSYTECEGRTCNFCRIKAGQPPAPPAQGEHPFPNYNPADITTEFGHRRYMEIGKSHLSNLEGWESAVTSQCCAHILNPQGQLLARCSQQLIRESYNCPHCNGVVIDLSTDPRSDEELDKATSKPYPCMKCQKGVLLKEIVSCDSCAQQGRMFSQLGVFDVVLWAKRQGEGTKSQMMLQQFQTVEEFSRSLPQPMQALLNGKTVADVIKELASPYDFDKMFEPRSFQEQATKLELNIAPPGQQLPPNAYTQPMQGYQPQQMVQQPMQPMQQVQPMMAPPPPPGAAPYVSYPPAPQQAGPGPQGFQAPMKPNFGK